jgi:Cation transporter/ATPase, N-terminus
MDVASDVAPLQAHGDAPQISAKTKKPAVHVSPAVLTAARKDGETLLRDLGTSLAGLSEAEAEERARTTGPNGSSIAGIRSIARCFKPPGSSSR